MMNAFKAKAKRCCSMEHERVSRKIGACEMETNNSDQRHDCYRQAAKESGRRARECMAA